MPIRPKPTKQLIIELGGNDSFLIKSAYEFFAEIPFHDIYPHLDMNETFAFAASARVSRTRREFDVFSGEDYYTIFNNIFEVGFPWLNKHKQISAKLQKKYDELNPFNGKNLKERIEGIDPTLLDSLKSRLLDRDVTDYVFYCQYHDKKRERGTNFRLEVMNFHNAYPPTRRKGEEFFKKQMNEMVARYASQIAKRISNFPQEFNPLREQKLYKQPDLL